MSWLTPIGFLGLIGLLILIIIYIIKPNYQNKVISSTFVWRLSLKYKKKKIPISKLRSSLYQEDPEFFRAPFPSRACYRLPSLRGSNKIPRIRQYFLFVLWLSANINFSFLSPNLKVDNFVLNRRLC